MTTNNTAPAVDTTAGKNAYILARAHEPELAPRLPAGLLVALAADLATLGVDLTPSPAAETPPPPPLAESVAVAASLISAIRGAVLGAKPKPEIRRAYGAKADDESLDAAEVLAVGGKIVERARANPTEALSLGILPADIANLEQALSDVRAAESAATVKAPKVGKGKARRAAAARMEDAVARIAGAGALAFAKDANVRAEFAALIVKPAA